MKTYMYRYTGTPGWVEISSRPTLPGVTVNSDILYGGSVPLAQFVGPSNVAKMRIVAFRNPQGSRAPAVMKVNRVGWTVTY